MTRQVIRRSDAAVRAAGTPGTQDEYLDRLLKLIPGETVAAYLFVVGVIQTALKAQPGALGLWLWIVFGVIGVGNFFYWKRAKVTDPAQYVLLTAAYVVWVFTIGGPFATTGWYQPFMGSVILGLFTFLAPQWYKGVPPS
jgi:hypothetical protein